MNFRLNVINKNSSLLLSKSHDFIIMKNFHVKNKCTFNLCFLNLISIHMRELMKLN